LFLLIIAILIPLIKEINIFAIDVDETCAKINSIMNKCN